VQAPDFLCRSGPEFPLCAGLSGASKPAGSLDPAEVGTRAAHTLARFQAIVNRLHPVGSQHHLVGVPHTDNGQRLPVADLAAHRVFVEAIRACWPLVLDFGV
jgi:hypothetical protein